MNALVDVPGVGRRATVPEAGAARERDHARAGRAARTPTRARRALRPAAGGGSIGGNLDVAFATVLGASSTSSGRGVSKGSARSSRVARAGSARRRAALAAEGARVAAARVASIGSRRSSHRPRRQRRGGCEQFVDRAVDGSAGSTSSSTTPVSPSAATRCGTSSQEDEREVIETNVLGADADDAALRAAPRGRRRRPHRQPRLGRRHLVVRERLVVCRVEVRGARLHACTARRPARQARSCHERRAGHGRDRLLQGALQGRRGEGGGGLPNVAMGGPLSAEDMADCVMFAVTRPPNVNIDEIVMMALAQTSGGTILRDRVATRLRACPSSAAGRTTTARTARPCRTGRRRRPRRRAPRSTNSSASMPSWTRAAQRSSSASSRSRCVE